MRIRLTILFCFLIGSSYSQNVIKGTIRSYDNSSIGGSLVQVLEKDTVNILAYGYSDDDGRFYLSFSGSNTEAIIKVAALGYVHYYSQISLTSKNNDVEVVLEKKTVELSEVIIVGNQGGATIRGDSIVYNLKSVRDSTEVTLGDLIKKLPGLELTSDGKVRFQGVFIDKILIDGSEFYGNKHQMATENIGAAMVEGIDLLLKHDESINLREFDENSKIALNVKLSSDSKNNILGNIEIGGGLKNKYALHTNLFRFFKKGNISWISDYNNVGEMPLTVPDFVDLIGGMESIPNSKAGITDISEMIPQYIYNEDQKRERKNTFSALNLSFRNKKITINSNLFFNNLKQTEGKTNEKIFLNESGVTLKESYLNNSKFGVVNGLFKVQYQINDKSNIKYSFNSTSTIGNSDEDIENLHSYHSTIYDKNIIISNLIKYQYKININLLFESQFYHRENSIKNVLDINSSDYNLLGFNRRNLTQTHTYQNNSLSGVTSLLYKQNKNKYKYSIVFERSDENLENTLPEDESNSVLHRQTQNWKNILDVTQYVSNSIFFRYVITINSLFIDNTQKNAIENYGSFNFEINKANNLSLSYSNDYRVTELIKELRGSYIINYQNLNLPENITNNPLVKNHR